MTEESSEVPRELTGKSGAAAGSPSAPAHPSPPPPCPPPPSRRSREVAAPLRSRPCWAGRRELCSRLAARKAQFGEGGRGGQRGPGSPGLLRSRDGGGGGRSGWKRGAGCLGLGSSGGEEPPLQRPAPCPKLGEVRERPAQGRGEGAASAQWVVSGTCRHSPHPGRGAPPTRRLRGGGASRECGLSRARRGFAQPAGSERVTGVTHAPAGKLRVNGMSYFNHN